MKILILLLLTIFTLSCQAPKQKTEAALVDQPMQQPSNAQIAEYVVATFQDSKGNLWFGTIDKGVAKYDGRQLVYLTIKDGLPSNRVVSIIEDNTANIWFGTGDGLSKYDGKTFINYSDKDGLCNNSISNLFIDSKGDFWVGSWGGICKFDGAHFEKFNLPNPSIDTQINQDTKDWNTEIMEDTKGNIWFGRDGYGACKYDGKSFVHITKKEGLNSNNVQAIVEDHEGNIWFGTRMAERDNADTSKRLGQGGLNKYEGKKMVYFTKIKGLSENDVYSIYRDNTNALWISTISNGVYKYENKEFVNYAVPVPIQTTCKDKSGNVWLGCSGGLYRIKPNGEVENVVSASLNDRFR